MLASDEKPLITGDVTSATEVSINKKGGSVAAILKKSLAQRLGKVPGKLVGAALPIENGPALLLLAAGQDSAGRETHVRVQRIASNRFEVALDEGSGNEVDEVTAAFLALKVEQFKAGELDLMPPVDADGWRAEMDAKFADVAGALTAAVAEPPVAAAASEARSEDP